MAIAIIAALLTGGVGKALVDQFLRGLRQRQQAAGLREMKSDALLRSRQRWVEHAQECRVMLRANGITPPMFDEDADPWVVWNAKFLYERTE